MQNKKMQNWKKLPEAHIVNQRAFAIKRTLPEKTAGFKGELLLPPAGSVEDID